MDNYLVDRETLGQFADALIKTKLGDQPTTNAADISAMRENIISTVDQRISDAIFGGLSDQALVELNALLDDENTSEPDFQNFFARSGVNLEEKIKNVFDTYKNEYLGGENA